MSRNKIKISSASTQNSNQKDLSAQQRTIAAAVIKEVMQASTYVTDDDTLFSRDSASALSRMYQIGTHATRNTSAVSTCYHPTYDHHVKIVNEELATVLFRILFFLCFNVLYYQFVFELWHPPLGSQLVPGLAWLHLKLQALAKHGLKLITYLKMRLIPRLITMQKHTVSERISDHSFGPI